MSDLFNPELYVSEISVYYGSKCAVQNVSFDIQPGQLTAIIGNNGCGKTSLIRAVMNLVKHSGKCMLGELQLESMSVRKRAGMISYIPQRNGISVSMTVRDVCLLGFNPQLHMLESYNSNMRHRADKAIDSVGLAGLYDTDFLTLSEGQKQLCILARTLIEDSALLLLDEPDSALDFSNRHMLMKHIRNIISDNKCALMCIHSPELALEYCDRILLMKDGKIVSDIDVHAASLSEINEKMSLIYDNINVTECTDTKGNVHRIVLAL
jgi:iron complex transport system ATP-binding protein